MKMKKSLLNLFVETEEDTLDSVQTNFVTVEPESCYTREQLNSININSMKSCDIQQIYADNKLQDKTRSIYKVEEIRGVLPSSLPVEDKKSAVLGMMAVSSINLNDVLIDASSRIETLKLCLQKYTEETTKVVLDNETQIAALEQQINSLKIEIANRRKLQEEQNRIITDEIEKVTSIVDFIS